MVSAGWPWGYLSLGYSAWHISSASWKYALLPVLPSLLKQELPVVQVGGQVGMALGIPLPGIQRLVDLQRPLVIPPRLPVVALGVKQAAQVVQVGGRSRIGPGIYSLEYSAWLISSARWKYGRAFP